MFPLKLRAPSKKTVLRLCALAALCLLSAALLIAYGAGVLPTGDSSMFDTVYIY